MHRPRTNDEGGRAAKRAPQPRALDRASATSEARPNPALPLALAAALAATSATSLLACKKPEAADTANKPAEEAPIAVKTATVGEQPMPRWLRLTGTLTADESADVAADVNGKLLEVKVDRGSMVAKGDVLARTDARGAALASAEASAGLEVAKAQTAQAKVDCDRLDALNKAGAIAGADYDRAHAQCVVSQQGEKLAAARVASASKPLGDANIRAPFAGLISDRYVNTGEYVRSDSKVVRLVSIDPVRIELSVPESSVGVVKEGQAVEFRVPAFKEPFKGSIRYIGPSLRAQSRDLVVEAVAANPDHKLRPGMFVTAQLDLGEADSVVIPKTAVRSDGQSAHVFFVKDGRLEERIVELGEEKGDLVAVPTGVKKGETVVTPVPAEARDGAKVK
jgi:membrane fusion protein (multidrug efflux system)